MISCPTDVTVFKEKMCQVHGCKMHDCPCWEEIKPRYFPTPRGASLPQLHVWLDVLDIDRNVYLGHLRRNRNIVPFVCGLHFPKAKQSLSCPILRLRRTQQSIIKILEEARIIPESVFPELTEEERNLMQKPAKSISPTSFAVSWYLRWNLWLRTLFGTFIEFSAL